MYKKTSEFSSYPPDFQKMISLWCRKNTRLRRLSTTLSPCKNSPPLQIQLIVLYVHLTLQFVKQFYVEPTAEYVLPQVAERYKHNPGGISRDTKKLIEAAGFQAVDEGETRQLRNVSRLGFHAFRHSYVSMLINNGVNPLAVRDLVGHTTVDMTVRDTHVALDTKLKAVQTLPVLGKSMNQPTSVADVISSLPMSKLHRLAACLERIFTASQKEELLRQL